MLNSLFKKAVEAVVVTTATAAAKKYGPTAIEAVKEKTPVVIDAVKENTAVAVQVVKSKLGR
jgi:hypothetical protein